MRIRKYARNREAYAAHRMSAAIDRMIVADSAEDKRQAARWATAWGAASGFPLAVETHAIRGRSKTSVNE
jgi:hypothetical protein